MDSEAVLITRRIPKPRKVWSARGPWISHSGYANPVFKANGKVRNADNWKQTLWLSPVTGKWVKRAAFELEEYARLPRHEGLKAL